MKILILDDYAAPRTDAKSALEQILAGETLEVDEFSDPNLALAAFSRQRYDLVVSDILMPDMDGFLFAAIALEQRAVPFIMHTGSWSKDYIAQFVLNGVGDRVPVSIVGKRYAHASFDEYAADMKQGLENARAKLNRLQPHTILKFLNHKLDTSCLARASQKLDHKQDTLVDYIKAVFKELVYDLKTTSSELQDEKLRERILGIEWTSDDKAKSTADYMHHFGGYPLPGLRLVLEYYKGNERESEAFKAVQGIYQRMQSISDIIQNHRFMAMITPPERREYERRLNARERRPIPRTEMPVKLLGRQIYYQHMFDESWTQHMHIIPPCDDPNLHEEKIELMLDQYSDPDHGHYLILRSMYRGEDGALPLAGFFKSVPIKTIQEYYEAVKEIRAMDNKRLAQFCLYQGLEQPDAKDMFIGVEVYHNSDWLGAMIEHPNQPGVYLIEFGTRSLGITNWVSEQSILYDANIGVVLNSKLIRILPMNRKPAELAAAIVSGCKYYLKTVGEPEQIASQVEFGFIFTDNDDIRSEAQKQGVNPEDVTNYYSIEEYQSRSFKPKSPSRDFIIPQPFKTVTVIGTTEQEGVDCVVIDTVDPVEYGILAEKARAQRYGVMYVSRPREEGKDGDAVKYDDINVASLVPNIDVLVLGKGLKVMGHAYFNAMVNAQNVVLLEPGTLDEFNFEKGSVVKYRSNGRECSFAKIDAVERIKYKIRDVLDKH